MYLFHHIYIEKFYLNWKCDIILQRSDFVKILIVEDDENIFEMLKRELLLWNYEVCGISNFNKIVEEFLDY